MGSVVGSASTEVVGNTGVGVPSEYGSISVSYEYAFDAVAQVTVVPIIAPSARIAKTIDAIVFFMVSFHCKCPSKHAERNEFASRAWRAGNDPEPKGSFSN